MEIRVKCFSYRRNRLYIHLFQLNHKLFVDLLHPFFKRTSLFCLGNCGKAPFKIIHHRQNLFDHTFRTGFKHGCFFLFRALAEIFKFRHLPFHTVFQLIYLFLKCVLLFICFQLLFGRLFICPGKRSATFRIGRFLSFHLFRGTFFRRFFRGLTFHNIFPGRCFL